MTDQRTLKRIIDDQRKEIADRDHDWKIICDRADVEIEGLKAKIEAAKPIIEQWCKECDEREFWINEDCQNDCTVHTLKALLFPRNREQPTCGFGSCDDNIFSQQCREIIQVLGCPRFQTEIELDTIPRKEPDDFSLTAYRFNKQAKETRKEEAKTT